MTCDWGRIRTSSPAPLFPKSECAGESSPWKRGLRILAVLHADDDQPFNGCTDNLMPRGLLFTDQLMYDLLPESTLVPTGLIVDVCLLLEEVLSSQPGEVVNDYRHPVPPSTPAGGGLFLDRSTNRCYKGLVERRLVVHSTPILSPLAPKHEAR